MTATSDTEQIAKAAALANFGVASAAKRGRNAKWPYVPIVIHNDCCRPTTVQIVGVAYATREEALARAQRHIDGCRSDLAKKLADPRMRALREQYGFPREVAR
jgi:hypothetical protein